MTDIRIIVSGGGTGGHIYPAVAVVEAIAKKIGRQNTHILFVGAQGKMEMSKVPQLGYEIEGLPIVGLQRSLSLRNLTLPFKLIKSLSMASEIIQRFKPHIVVGFGGYASTPILWAAQRKNIPTMIWEGNSFPGMANRFLGRKADKVFVSYEGMDRYFEKEKCVMAGNPVRGRLVDPIEKKNKEALEFFGFDSQRPVVLVSGGSLGAGVLNQSVIKHIDTIVEDKSINLIWQTGSYYYESIKEIMKGRDHSNVWFSDFINRMDYAYSAADVAIMRAGASTIAELQLTATPAILVPSANVTENHQYKNAIKLVEKNAAVLITDDNALQRAIPDAIELANDIKRLKNMSDNIHRMANRGSADLIADVILKKL